MHPPALVPAAEFEARFGRPVPANLWVQGCLDGLGRKTVAIVGTRAATPYGRRLARHFARALGEAGCCIISGLALGIDAEAHAGALSNGTPTIGVLGGGHERFYPKRNAALASRMCAEGGAVISPFEPQQPPLPHLFLARNAVVAALADCVLVVEAPARSGALNTAQWAAERVPVFAIPADVDRVHSAGCLALIRDGAILARDPADVLEVLAPDGVAPAALPRHQTEIGDPVARDIYRALAPGERTIDELIAESGVPAPLVLASVSALEMQGAVEYRGGGRYGRAASLLS